MKISAIQGSLVVVLMLSLLACEKAQPDSDLGATIREEFVGNFMILEKTFADYFDLNIAPRFIRQKVWSAEIKGSTYAGNQNYDFYLDGNWQLGLTVIEESDNKLFLEVERNSGYWTDGTRFDLKGEIGWPEMDFDHFTVVFNGDNGKLQLCVRYFNISPSQGYDIIQFLEIN